jgi:hypothetical protein
LTEHVSTSQLERLCVSLLPEAESAAIAEHLRDCQRCHRLFDSELGRQRGSGPISINLTPEFQLRHEHLDFDQLLQVVEGQPEATDCEVIDAHLSACPNCRERVSSLTDFSAQLNEELHTPPGGRNKPAIVEKSWVSNWWSGLAWKPAYVAVMLLIGVALVIGVVILRWRASNLQAHQASPSPIPSIGPAESNNTATPGPGRESPKSPLVPAPPEQQTAINDQGFKSPLRPPKRFEANKGVTANALAPVTINDGQWHIRLDEHGQLIGLASLPASWQQRVRAVLVARDFSYPTSMAQLRQPPRTLMGETDKGVPFALLAPVGKVVITTRPSFSWSKYDGATSYRVSVFDSDANEIETSPPLTLTEWTVTKPLARDQVYTWEVTAIKDGKETITHVLPAPPARFRVIGQGPADEIESAQHLSPPSHLALGVLYVDNGLFAEAELEIKSIADANSHDPLIKKLLRRLQAFQKR